MHTYYICPKTGVLWFVDAEGKTSLSIGSSILHNAYIGRWIGELKEEGKLVDGGEKGWDKSKPLTNNISTIVNFFGSLDKRFISRLFAGYQTNFTYEQSKVVKSFLFNRALTKNGLKKMELHLNRDGGEVGSNDGSDYYSKKIQKLNELRGSSDKWQVVDIVSDFSGERPFTCTLGHRLKTKFIAKDELSDRTLEFGETCVTDFFHLDEQTKAGLGNLAGVWKRELFRYLLQSSSATPMHLLQDKGFILSVLVQYAKKAGLPYADYSLENALKALPKTLLPLIKQSMSFMEVGLPIPMSFYDSILDEHDLICGDTRKMLHSPFRFVGDDNFVISSPIPEIIPGYWNTVSASSDSVAMGTFYPLYRNSDKLSAKTNYKQNPLRYDGYGLPVAVSSRVFVELSGNSKEKGSIESDVMLALLYHTDLESLIKRVALAGTLAKDMFGTGPFKWWLPQNPPSGFKGCLSGQLTREATVLAQHEVLRVAFGITPSTDGSVPTILQARQFLEENVHVQTFVNNLSQVHLYKFWKENDQKRQQKGEELKDKIVREFDGHFNNRFNPRSWYTKDLIYAKKWLADRDVMMVLSNISFNEFTSRELYDKFKGLGIELIEDEVFFGDDISDKKYRGQEVSYNLAAALSFVFGVAPPEGTVNFLNVEINETRIDALLGCYKLYPDLIKKASMLPNHSAISFLKSELDRLSQSVTIEKDAEYYKAFVAVLNQFRTPGLREILQEFTNRLLPLAAEGSIAHDILSRQFADAGDYYLTPTPKQSFRIRELPLDSVKIPERLEDFKHVFVNGINNRDAFRRKR